MLPATLRVTKPIAPTVSISFAYFDEIPSTSPQPRSPGENVFGQFICFAIIIQLFVFQTLYYGVREIMSTNVSLIMRHNVS